ncbi:MAG: ABC transporter ATP-binding protein, partial [Gammaproteobacteria bacterium]|nr:ABC transporter ATP-binding protein [Gammaproteobacteria bacterium]
MSGPVLELAGARCTLGQRQALDGVDLSVNAGELVALLGPNGAGKTTLLRACSGRIRLSAGTARVAGRNPATDPAARRALGIVPQNIALYPQLAAQDNLSVFAQLAGLRGAARRAAVARALQRAGLQARAGELVKNLSGGMQRRLNIVAGALHEPRLLLLDEPTVGVDPAARESIHALLEKLRADGMGLLLTTHDLEQA